MTTINKFSTDSGTVGDNITNDSTLTLTGTATANSTVNVYDGSALLGSATANASGAWSYTTGTLSNGSHSFTAATTSAGSPHPFFRLSRRIDNRCAFWHVAHHGEWKFHLELRWTDH